jgi:signal transduction histidine kinase
MEGIRREWHWFDWITVSMRALFYFIFIVSMYTDPTNLIPLKGYPYWLSLAGLPHGITLGWLTFSFFISHIFWNPKLVHQRNAYRVEIFLLICLIILCFTVDLRYAHLFPLYCLHLGFVGSKRKALWSISLIVLFVMVIGFFQREVQPYLYLFYIIYCFLTFGYSYVFYRMIESEQQMKRLLAENEEQYRLIQEKNTALIQYTKQIEKLTIVEERNRMASELHDTVGHTFTSVIMGMDAVSYLIESAPDKAKEKLDVLRDLMRNGLKEVRQNIHQIADENTSSLSIQMTLLANEFSHHTGTDIKLVVEGKEYEVSKPIRWALFRCLQESITNAKRHGQAMTIQVKLEYLARKIRLSVQDDGIGAAFIEYGFGLTTMKERLRSLNGDLKIQTHQGKGTMIICCLPIGGEENDEATDR